MNDFIEITFSEDEEHITSPMPHDCADVEVRLDDGSVVPAYFEKNIMDAGDWDFMPVGANGEPTDESLSDRVRAWRYAERHPDLFTVPAKAEPRS